MREELHNSRKKLKLTQQQVADRVGISRSFYCRIELGKEDPNLEYACKIVHVLNTNIENAFNDIFLRFDVRSRNKIAV
jgi:putative transcriptional regulator